MQHKLNDLIMNLLVEVSIFLCTLTIFELEKLFVEKTKQE